MIHRKPRVLAVRSFVEQKSRRTAAKALVQLRKKEQRLRRQIERLYAAPFRWLQRKPFEKQGELRLKANQIRLTRYKPLVEKRVELLDFLNVNQKKEAATLLQCQLEISTAEHPSKKRKLVRTALKQTRDLLHSVNRSLQIGHSLFRYYAVRHQMKLSKPERKELDDIQYSVQRFLWEKQTFKNNILAVESDLLQLLEFSPTQTL